MTGVRIFRYVEPLDAFLVTDEYRFLAELILYSEEFKATAVKLSRLAGVRVQDVAQAVDAHPFMLSRWRKEARKVWENIWVACQTCVS